MNIRSNFNSIYSKVGMTPQFDCLWEFLTGREHLRLYGRITGTYYYSCPEEK